MSRPGRVWSHDQAAGLRRLFKSRTSLTVAFVAGMPGVGTTRFLAQTALQLAAQDQQVLLVDEQGGSRNATAALGVGYRFDLAQALAGDLTVDQVLVPVTDKLKVLPAAKAVRLLRQNEASGRQELAARLGTTWRSQNFVLVDAGMEEGAQPLSLLGRTAGHIVLVVGTGTTAVTASYLLVKRLAAAYPTARLSIVVSRARSEEEARGIAANLQLVARQHLGLELGWLGWVPQDPGWREGGAGFAASPAVLACTHLAQSLLQLAGMSDANGHKTPPPGRATLLHNVSA